MADTVDLRLTNPARAVGRTPVEASARKGRWPLIAVGAVGVVLAANVLVGRRTAPDPSHPSIRRRNRRRDEPGITPPGGTGS